MNTDRVSLREEPFPVDAFGAGLPGSFIGQVLAPGDHPHAERFAVSRHIGPDAPEPDNAECASLEIDSRPYAFLETAGPHRGVPRWNLARRREQERQSHFRGGGGRVSA